MPENQPQSAESDAPKTIVHSTGPLCSCSIARAGEVVQYARETVYHVRYPANCYAAPTRVTPPAECDGCLCPTEHDGDYGSSGHPGPCPPHTCVTSPGSGHDA